MRKIALVLLVAAAAMAVASKKHDKEDDRNRGEAMESAAGNDISDGSSLKVEVATEYNRFQAGGYEAPDPVTVKQSSKQHNAKLLNKLGMKRVRNGGGGGGAVDGASGANHHRKRLASQSRSKYGTGGMDGGKGAGDSQMFIVKLPPHAHFYDDGSAAAVHQRLQHKHQHKQTASSYNGLNTVPVGFVSNGKPAKVYHWNLPTIKHALQAGGGRYKMQTVGGNDVVSAQHRNQLMQQYGQPSDLDLPSGSKILPRRTIYYKPRAAGKPMKKSFVNNGKPNGFYVVSTKNAASAVPQYHKIIKAYYGSGDD